MELRRSQSDMGEQGEREEAAGLADAAAGGRRSSAQMEMSQAALQSMIDGIEGKQPGGGDEADAEKAKEEAEALESLQVEKSWLYEETMREETILRKMDHAMDEENVEREQGGAVDQTSAGGESSDADVDRGGIGTEGRAAERSPEPGIDAGSDESEERKGREIDQITRERLVANGLLQDNEDVPRTNGSEAGVQQSTSQQILLAEEAALPEVKENQEQVTRGDIEQSRTKDAAADSAGDDVAVGVMMPLEQYKEDATEEKKGIDELIEQKQKEEAVGVMGEVDDATSGVNKSEVEHDRMEVPAMTEYEKQNESKQDVDDVEESHAENEPEGEVGNKEEASRDDGSLHQPIVDQQVVEDEFDF